MSDSKIMSDSHWLGRIRDLMQQVGMPASQSLYLAFTQLMFEMQREALATAPRAALPEVPHWSESARARINELEEALRTVDMWMANGDYALAGEAVYRTLNQKR